MEAGPEERLDAGASGLRKPGSPGHDGGETKPAVHTMGISVALQGDARQAAAVKLAEEQALVRNAQAGDRLAFEELVRRYDREVLRLALNLVHRSEDARDIYQEAFLRVYRNLHRFRFECSFYTWLYRIVTNVALDHLRRRTSRREDQAPVPEEADGGTRDFFDRQPEVSAAANPEKRLLGQELGEHIQTALERLSPRERVVFEMKHYQGMKLRAIGDMLGTSEETVKNSLFRATRKLRANLNFMR
jgi:RNA polymerase sigma-70 factor (ECF subfamily)